MLACCFSGSISVVLVFLYPKTKRAGINNIKNGDTGLDDFFMMFE